MQQLGMRCGCGHIGMTPTGCIWLSCSAAVDPEFLAIMRPRLPAAKWPRDWVAQWRSAATRTAPTTDKTCDLQLIAIACPRGHADIAKHLGQ